MFNRIRFRNCVHQGVAGATEEAILAAIRGDSLVCAPGDLSTILSRQTVFAGLSRYLGAEAFKQCWMDYQRASQARTAQGGSSLAALPTYLAEHRYGRERPELVDLARLDLAVFLAGAATAQPSLDHCCLPDAILADHPALTIKMQPNWQYLKSNWPIQQFRDALLRRPDGGARIKPPRPATVWLNVLPVGDEISIRELPPAQFQFESALQRGQSLQEAGRSAAEIDPKFESLTALKVLIDARAIADVDLHPAAAPTTDATS